jgi:hypothetical protein
MALRAILLTFLTVLFSAGLVNAQTTSDTPEKQGQTAAEQWLKLLDNGDYGTSWEKTAAFFREKVTKQQWLAAMNQSRVPIGKTVKRTLKSATYLKNIPDMKEGNYVIAQFNTDFEKKKNAVETITLMKESDGSWRVIGFYIQ